MAAWKYFLHSKAIDSIGYVQQKGRQRWHTLTLRSPCSNSSFLKKKSKVKDKFRTTFCQIWDHTTCNLNKGICAIECMHLDPRSQALYWWGVIYWSMIWKFVAANFWFNLSPYGSATYSADVDTLLRNRRKITTGDFEGRGPTYCRGHYWLILCWIKVCLVKLIFHWIPVVLHSSCTAFFPW